MVPGLVGALRVVLCVAGHLDWIQGLVHVLELTDGTSVDSCLLVLDQVPEVGHLLLLHLGVDD